MTRRFLLIATIIIAAVAFLGGNDEVMVDSSAKMAYYNGNQKHPNISLMVNVYWGTEYLEQMLDIFKENDVKTTFFLGGMWVLDDEALVKQMQAEGHELANHGYKHKSQDKLTYEQAKTVAGIDLPIFLPKIEPKNKTMEETIKNVIN